ncbi:MAG TPA: dihydroxyacetone kinase subunit DhaL [Micromonosporaceae bacterium]|nr:dihydroxyacetone kinase subunit DhaL [Micromonosporaceae bacterium]
MDVPLARRWLEMIATAVASQAEHLTQLDSAIGDADHGVNLDRGFTAVRAALDGFEAATVGDVFVKAGNTLVSKVGGASGPLYGSAFRAIGKALPGPTCTAAEFGQALQAGLDAIQRLGAAAPGDKTMVDAYGPAVLAFTKALGAQPDTRLSAAAAAAAAAAADGMRATIALQARKGRASYLGPRSVGHQDPGATSTSLIFSALADATTSAA